MKKLLAIMLCLAMVLTMAACVATAPKETLPETPDQSTPAAQEDDTTAGEALQKITLIVVHADGTQKEFTYETGEQFLGAVVAADGLVKGNNGPYGLEITEVDGEQAIYDTDKAYWALYEGEEYALQGIDTTPVKDGATYKLVYTKA